MTDLGAHFFRCDFQVHTPRDGNWHGESPTDDDGRKRWADSLVEACRVKGLNSIAITDHHDFTSFPYVRDAAEREVGPNGDALPVEKRLVVFPGLELTLSVPCQALLILDAGFPEDRLDGVLARLAIQKVDPAEARLPSVQPIEIALLSELYAELDKEPWLRNRYIVFPNVTDGGYQTLLRSKMSHKYRDMPCVGGYLDGTVEKKVGAGNRRIFDGLNSDYGSKRIALIQTSDNRKATFEDLGKHSTWIKWAFPSAEALRQACLAQESRISQVQPDLPNVSITRLSVDNSMFMGPINLEFNHEFNAIIGGRGTGKSTLLDYLRWGLCDLTAKADDEELGDPAARRQKLVTATLSPTESTVEVHFSINEIPHVVRRSAKNAEVTLKVGNNEFIKAREAEVRELLPIQAYSQKQLSSVSVRMEELTRFVTSPIRRDLATIDQGIGEATARVRENYAKLQRKRQLQGAIRHLELSEKSLADQAANLRASLVDVSDEDQQILADKPKYDRSQAITDGIVDAAESGLQIAERATEALADLVESIPIVDGIPDLLRNSLVDFRANTVKLLTDFNSEFGASLASIRAEISEPSEHESLRNTLLRLIEAYEKSYDEVKEKSSAQAAKLEELEQVERQHKSAGIALRVQREELRGVERSDVEHIESLHGLFLLMEARSDRLALQCDSLSAASSGLLRASMQRGRGLKDVAEKFRAAVSGSNLRGNRIDDFFDQLSTEEDPVKTWEAAVNELEGLTLLEDNTTITSEHFKVLARLGFQPADLKRISSKLTTDTWLSLAVTAVTDEPKFEYRTKEDSYIDFASASAGQQATALLRVLLAQPGPPLIIDQPEDDLDSEVVLNVVEQIWRAKRHRQLVFSSHNANLVVNGDAELVIHCDYRVQGEQSRGQVKGQGAIDIPEIREAITRVMEGGEKAFRLRANKYGF